MSVGDYGACVYRNGERRPDKEDAPIYIPYFEWLNGEEYNVLPEVQEILNNLDPDDDLSDNVYMWSYSVHGVLGDGRIRVGCYKQGFPMLIEWEEGATEPHAIDCSAAESDDFDAFSYEPVDFEYKGYLFHFESGSEDEDYNRLTPYVAEMTEPDGTVWRCTYDYGYGAGLTEGKLDESGYYIPYNESADED